jgi:hypothetical protein
MPLQLTDRDKMQKYVTVSGGSPHARLKMLGYYLQRLCTSRRIRRVAASTVVAGLSVVHGKRKGRSAQDPAMVETLRMQGYVRLGRLLSPQQCAEMLAYLGQQDMVATRGSGASFRLDAVPDGTPFGEYSLETVANCPHVMEFANHPDSLRLASGYLGYTPTITLISMRWSFPNGAADADVQHFHRDSELGSMKLMVYLTDVDEASGPHRFVAGSHGDRMPLRMQRYSECEVNLRHGGSTAITGPAGTGFAIDGKGIHQGTPPISKPRLMLAVQYSLLPCLIYEYTPVEYRGPCRTDAYINRLMVAGGPSRAAAYTGEQDMAPLPE